MPDVVWPNGLVTLVVITAAHLWRPVTGVLHHPADGVDRDLDALASKLIANL